MNNLGIILTEDGSTTIFNSEKNEHFHSIHGAVQESMHVFIENGYKYRHSLYADKLRLNQDKENTRGEKLNILEIGFGTGLNALLTLNEILINETDSPSVYYTGIEPNPLDQSIAELLNYCSFPEIRVPIANFMQMHSAGILKNLRLNNKFDFTKEITTFQEFSNPSVQFDLVYFDAFSPVAEPDLWTDQIFEKIYSMMNVDGVLVTYCSKGSVRRSLQHQGFKTERLPGPPGKHEMLRATKLKL